MLSKTARLARLTMPATSAPTPGNDIDGSAVKTLKKALGLLRFIAAAERPVTVAAVALGAGISRPTAHRLCQTLVTEGFLSQDESSGRLSIGYGVLPLAASHLDSNRLRLEAFSFERARATDETASEFRSYVPSQNPLFGRNREAQFTDDIFPVWKDGASSLLLHGQSNFGQPADRFRYTDVLVAGRSGNPEQHYRSSKV